MRAESVESSQSAAPQCAARPGVLRLLAIGAQLAGGLAAAWLIFPFASRSMRLAMRRRWAEGMLDAIGIDLRAEGAALAPGALLLANHVSWLDVLVLAARAPAIFVAKSEVRCWPAIGWLAERVETLFLRRASGRPRFIKNGIAGPLSPVVGWRCFRGLDERRTGSAAIRSGLVPLPGRPVQLIASPTTDGRPSWRAIDGGSCGRRSLICGSGASPRALPSPRRSCPPAGHANSSPAKRTAPWRRTSTRRPEPRASARAKEAR
jgi:hypothetical protein